MGAKRVVGWVVALLAVAFVAGMAVSVTRTPTPPPTNSTLPASGDGLTVVAGVPYYRNGPTLDLFLPEPRSDTPVPAVVFIHGGGWTGGDQVAFADWGARTVRDFGWAAVSIGYRLASPDAPAWPDEFHDAQAAVRFVAANAGPLGIDPSRIVVVGESAGGNLAALLSSLGTADPLSGTPAGVDGAGRTIPDVSVGGEPLTFAPTDLDVGIAAVALWSPPTELAPLDPPAGGGPAPGCGDNKACEFVWDGGAVERYLGCDAAACPDLYADASPLTHVSRSTRPTFIANSEAELVPLNQATDYAAALSSAGVDHELEILDGTFHGLQLGDDVWRQTVAFLAARVDPGLQLPQGDSRLSWFALVGAGIAVGIAVPLGVRRRRAKQ